MDSKKTILIAEDEEAILQALQRILELTSKYEVLTASDGQAALMQLKTITPDLIISDISMPHLDGLTLCRMVRENPLTQTIPFIFLTGKKDKMVEGLTAGGDDFLLKPFNVEEVIVKIESVFRRIEQSRQQAIQHKGNLQEFSLDVLLSICLDQRISGELVLQNENSVAVIVLENGDIESVQLEDLSDGAALDMMRTWQQGTFVIRPTDLRLDLNLTPSEKSFDLNQAWQIAEGVWWVGHYDAPNQILQNVYLFRHEKKGKEISGVIDPGTPLHFAENAKKIAQVVGDIAQVQIYFLLDSTPDVCLNNVFYRKANPKAICITEKANWQAIKHYEINPKSVKIVDADQNPELTMVSGHKMRFLPVAYTSTTGAWMLYDTHSRILYSGLLFSAHYYTENSDKAGLYAEEADWDAMRRFHQQNIASSTALLNAVNMINSLEPKPKLIAPRFGKMVRQEMIPFFMERLLLLQVGIDKVFYESLDAENALSIEAANTLLAQIQTYIPLKQALEIIKNSPKLSAMCGLGDGMIYALTAKIDDFYKILIDELARETDEKTAGLIKSIGYKIAYSLGLEINTA